MPSRPRRPHSGGHETGRGPVPGSPFSRAKGIVISLCRHLTKSKSAAGYHAGARTNERFHCLASRSLTPERSAGPPRPVGCICGLGGAGATSRLGKTPCAVGSAEDDGDQGWNADDQPQRLPEAGDRAPEADRIHFRERQGEPTAITLDRLTERDTRDRIGSHDDPVPTQDPTLPPDLYLLALFPRPRCQVRGLMPTGAASSGAEHEADPQSMWSHSPLRASREAWRPPNG